MQTVIFSLLMALMSEKILAQQNLPIFQKTKAIDNNDELIIDEKSLPRELLEGLEKDEIVEQMTLSVDNRKRSIDIRKRSEHAIDISVDPEEEKRLISELLSEAIGNSESSRSGDSTVEEDRQNFLASGLSRRQLLEILGDTRNLDRTVPANRGFTRKTSDLSNSERITIDEEKLPGTRQADGTICIEKVFLVNETEYERGMECHHTLKKKCHLTYITDYHPAAEKKCDTTFKKNCHITFKPVPHTEKVKKCHTPYIQKCGDEIEGPEVCTTQYETHCETTYKEYELEEDEPNCKLVEELRCTNKSIELLHLPHKEGESRFAVKERCEKWPVQKCDLETKNVKKVHPQTECEKVPRKVCTPSNCETKPGEEICHEESRTQIQSVPEEDCDLEPQENCRMETSLVPKLIPKKNCVKVPKEVCVNTKKNPKQVERKVFKNWCFDPTEIQS